MPIYSFICNDCGHRVELVRSMRDSDCKQTCAICGVTMDRDFHADLFHAQSQGKGYSRAIHSDSLAISPDQRKEHERLFPNIRIDNENRPTFDNYLDHDAYLKKCGIIKNRQRIRRKTKKVF